jgi:hypothetical protein
MRLGRLETGRKPRGEGGRLFILSGTSHTSVMGSGSPIRSTGVERFRVLAAREIHV